MAGELIPSDCAAFLTDLKVRIRQRWLPQAFSVNRELVLLYWQIGRDILLRQQEGGWGSEVIERLFRDLRAEFREMKGFSPHKPALYAGLRWCLTGRVNCPAQLEPQCASLADRGPLGGAARKSAVKLREHPPHAAVRSRAAGAERPALVRLPDFRR